MTIASAPKVGINTEHLGKAKYKAQSDSNTTSNSVPNPKSNVCTGQRHCNRIKGQCIRSEFRHSSHVIPKLTHTQLKGLGLILDDSVRAMPCRNSFRRPVPKNVDNKGPSLQNAHLEWVRQLTNLRITPTRWVGSQVSVGVQG